MNGIQNWLDSSLILGNTPAAYGYAIAAFAVALTLLHLIKNIGLTRLQVLAEKTKTDLDDLLVALIRKFGWPDYQLLAFFIATRYLDRSTAFDKGLLSALLLLFTYRGILIGQTLITYWLNKMAAKRELTEDARASVVQSSQIILRTLLWVGASLFVLSNMGVNISSVLAGLGIGGVAVALASQAILGDLFNFFVILLDKPFAVGDFIVADPIVGTVEKLGLKSIRIRSLSGEQLIVSNTKLLGMEVKNYKRMQRRRVLTTATVTYQTPLEKLKAIPGMIKEVVTGLEKVTFDRCNLSNLGAFSIDFETVYYLEDPDYNLHMITKELMLQAIIAKFQKEGIEFAYPTQTLFVNK
jgi:small-conductance mechanosensitive channel